MPKCTALQLGILALSMAGCIEGITDADDTVASVEISADTLRLLAFSEAQAQATAVTASGAPLSQAPIQWTTADTAVATVTSDGRVSGVSVGETELIATSGAHADTAVVAVSAPVIAEIRLSAADTLVLGEEGTLTVVAEALDASGRIVRGMPISWTSDDGLVASVDADGEIRGAGIGRARVVARGGGKYAALEVVVTAGWVKLMPARFHTCGLRVNGVVYCWGRGASQGVLGIESTRPEHHAPAPVAGNHQFVDLVTGEYSSCATTETRDVYCWGPNYQGLLGVGDANQRNVPTPIAGGVRFSSISMAEQHVCGIGLDTRAYCWGDQHTGVLGYRTESSVYAPRALPQSFQQMATSSWSFTCAIDDAGAPFCWGGRQHYEPLDPGECDNTICYEPVRIGDAALRFTELSPAYHHTCGLTASGAVHCWGANAKTPRQVPTSVAFVKLSESTVGAEYTCGLTREDQAYCWRWKWETGVAPDLTPFALPGDLKLKKIVVSWIGTSGDELQGGTLCGITLTNAAYCWKHPHQDSAPTLVDLPLESGL